MGIFLEDFSWHFFHNNQKNPAANAWRTLNLRWPVDSQRESGRFARIDSQEKPLIFITCERFAQIASNLRFAIFSRPKRYLQKNQKGLEVCYCLWGCHPDPRLGPIPGPSRSHPGSEVVPSRFAMCFVLQCFGPIQVPRWGPSRPVLVPSCSQAFLTGSGLDGQKQTSWPLPKKGFSSGTLGRFARIRRFARICESIRANRAI